MTPSLPARSRRRYTFEGREIRPLGQENDKAFALINALDADAAQPGDPQLPRRRISCSDRARTAGRFSRKGFARRRCRRRSRRCCSTSFASGPAS